MYVAVDIGNSKADLVMLSREGEVLRWVRTGRLVPNELSAEVTARSLANMLSGAPEVAGSWMGVAGVDFPDQALSLHQALTEEGMFGDVSVSNDIDALLYLDDAESDCRVAVVLGAGMNAVGVAPGHEVRFAALGTMSGDVAGGGAIGEAAVVAACRSADGRGSRSSLESVVPVQLGYANTDIMSRALVELPSSERGLHDLVPLVFEEARAGDAVALAIVHAQAEEVASVLRAVARRTGRDAAEFEVIGGGSVMRFGRDLLEPEISRALGESVRLAIPDVPPVLGAARRVLASNGVEVSVAFLQEQLAQMEPELVGG